MYWARSRVVEYLQGIRGQLPDGVDPVIGPDATGVGWVFEYALVDETGQHDLADLRGFQDWYLRYWLASVPGVAEVASIGGFVKQYQVNLDPNKLAAYDLAVGDVVQAIKASNNDVEGRLLEFAGREYMVRGQGYLTSAADIEVISLGADSRGTPIRVTDVGEVRLGPDIRRGVAELDGRGEVVGGIVIMRYGENALAVIDRVKAKLREVEDSLPPGVTVVPTYDRSWLIEESISTLSRTLIEEAVVVSLVIIVFLFHFRSALILILTLPIAVVAAFIPMYHLGVSSNIMSLGGIALAIGVLVDASIVMVENAYRHVSEATVPYEEQPSVILAAAKQVGRPIFFSLAIIIISFGPVFLLEAQEGRMFRPLAFTKTFVMVFASILSITLVPVLMTVFIRGRRLKPESANPVARFFTWLYAPVLRLALRWKWMALVVNFAVVPLTVPLLFTIGSEFMPPLYEGSMLYMPTAPPGLSVGEATRLLQVQDKLLRQFPEVERVFGTVGRATTSTDNSPMGMVNTTVTLKPKDEWRPGLTTEQLQSEMDEALQFPGFHNVWTQPIRNRLDMLLTGIKTPVGIKIFGTDLAVIQRVGEDIERILQDVPGTRSVYAERVNQGYFTDIRVDRQAIARHGLTIEAVQDVIQAALGGQNVTRTIEGRERYPVNVRYARAFREDLPAIERVLVRTPMGSQIPLGQLAEIRFTPGPAMIRDEDGQLAGYVYVDTATADIGGYVDSARAALGDRLQLPAGYTLGWTGQYEFQVRGAGAVAGPDFDRLLHHLHAALHDLPFGVGGGRRDAVRGLCHDRRRPPPVVARLQLLGRRLGRLHRPVRRGGADRCRDGDLPPRSARPAPAPGWRDHGERHSGSDDGGLRPSPATQAHDRQCRHGRAHSHHVEYRRQLGRDETDCHTDHRRDGHVDDSRARHHPRDLLHHETAGSAEGKARGVRDERVDRDFSVPHTNVCTVWGSGRSAMQ